MAGSDLVRAFVAVHLPGELLAALEELQQRLQAGLPKEAVRWTPPAQIHLTLKFLGNIAAADVDEVKAALATICRNSAPLFLGAEGLGCFPSLGRPRVIWVGLRGEVAQLQVLQSRIDSALQPWCERNEERPFRAHLTIGRVREISPSASRKVGARVKSTAIAGLGEWTVSQIHLMRSQLSPKGAEHSVLVALPLGAGE